jgi:hypothetical protein
MTTGYVYCLSNESMPDLVKIGMTERTMEIRLKEANKRDTFKSPTPYICEIAKKVNNPKQKEKILHNIFTRLDMRVNSSGEFFRVSVADVKLYFELMDGELWQPKRVLKYGSGEGESVSESSDSEESVLSDDEEVSIYDEDSSPDTSPPKHKKIIRKTTNNFKNETDILLENVRKLNDKFNDRNSSSIKPKFKHLISKLELKQIKLDGYTGCREPKKCLKDGQRIRYWVGDAGYAIAIYVSKTNIFYDFYDDSNETVYNSLSDFVRSHNYLMDAKNTGNGIWNKCECEINKKWISMEWLPPYTQKVIHEKIVKRR